MPTITVYLTNDLYLKVKDAPSRIIKIALQHYFTDEEDDPAEAPDQPRSQSQNPPKQARPAQ